MFAKPPLLSVLAVLLVGLATFHAAAAEPIRPVYSSQTESRIARELDTMSVMDCIEAPITEMLRFLESKHRIPIRYTPAAAEVARNSVATCTVEGVALSTVLDLLFREADLGWLVKDDALLITTTAELVQTPMVRAYDISASIGRHCAASDLAQDLSQLLTSAGGNQGGQEHGAEEWAPAVVVSNNALLVRAPKAGHENFVRMLTELSASLNTSAVNSDQAGGGMALTIEQPSGFALLGFMDFNGDGIDDHRMMQLVIEAGGGCVDAYLSPGEDPQVVGELKNRTRYLVFGAPPTAESPQALLEAHTKLWRDAKKAKLTVIPADIAFRALWPR